MNWLELLEKAIAETNQATVARRLGYSSSALSQARSGTYKGSTDKLAQKIIEIYGNETVDCPVLAKIPLIRCAEERVKPFSTANPERVRLFKACGGCEHKPR
ncbi:MAG: hypothetical protein OEV64_05995 [Desulfobulbaceae bacterium]|nr:hypothetical protein [Desulfobulbaceae bacterium]